MRGKYDLPLGSSWRFPLILYVTFRQVSLSGFDDAYFKGRGIHMPLTLEILQYYKAAGTLELEDFTLDFLIDNWNSAIALDPEFMAFNNDGTELYLNLQDNSALVRIDTESATAVAIDSYTLKEYSNAATGPKLDLVTDGACTRTVTAPCLALARTPDGIATVEVDGVNYVLTADEGSDYGLDEYEEKIDAKDMFTGSTLGLTGFTAPTTVFDPADPMGVGCAANFNSDCDTSTVPGGWCAGDFEMTLGSSAVDYTDPSAPVLNKIIGFGGRGVSIFKVPSSATESISLVWDSVRYRRRLPKCGQPSDTNLTRFSCLTLFLFAQQYRLRTLKKRRVNRFHGRRMLCRTKNLLRVAAWHTLTTARRGNSTRTIKTVSMISTCDAYKIQTSRSGLVLDSLAPSLLCAQHMTHFLACFCTCRVLFCFVRNLPPPDGEGCTDGGDGQQGACPMKNTVDRKSLEDGPGVEAVVVGVACDRLVMVGCGENNAMCLMYDITDIENPVFKKVFSLSPASEDLNPAVAYARRTLGDIDSETIKFLTADESPTGNTGIMFGGAISGTLSFYEFVCSIEEKGSAATRPLLFGVGTTVLVTVVVSAAMALLRM